MTPEGWRSTTYGEIAQINRESLSAKTPPHHRIAYLDLTSVPSTGTLTAPRDLSFAEAPSRARRVAKDGDTLVSTVRPYLRSFAFLKRPPDNLIVSTGFAVLTPREDIEPSFLYQTILRDSFVGYLSHRMKGSNYPAVNSSDVAEAPLMIPPRPEQKRIAAILSSVDDAIAATQAVIDQTRKVKQGLLKQLLTQGIGHTRFKQTEIGEIPESWRAVRVDQMGEVKAGRQRSPHFKDGAIRPYLRVANVFDGFIDATDVLGMRFTDSEYERYRLQHGDILLNERQSLELVRRCAMYGGVPADCCFQNTLVRFRPGPVTHSRFAQALFQHCHYSGKFSQIAVQTTSVAHLGVGRFAALTLGWPRLAEQKAIADTVQRIDAALDKHEIEKEALGRLKRGLMQDLLTGRVRVNTPSTHLQATRS